jgi:hypothetical protein
MPTMARPNKPTEDPKQKLRKLRDRLAFETARARGRNVPPDLLRRLLSAAELVAQIGELKAAPDEVFEDAFIEATLALHEWERWLEQADGPKPKTPLRPTTGSNPIDRRQTERLEAQATVRILRYVVDEGTVEADSVVRQARNVSLGGIAVSLAPGDLPRVGVGCVVHLSIAAAGKPTVYQVRAVVTRRGEDGLALKWLHDANNTVSLLVSAIRK